MAVSRFFVAAFFAASSIPAIAGIVVVGNGAARSCYEAADAVARPTPRDLQRCNEAIVDPGISYHDLVASHVNRGIVRLRSDQIDESIADFDRAIELDPNQAEAYLNKGAALLRRNGLWGGGYDYEALNLVDGRRTVGQIRDALAAIYGPVPEAEVSEYLQALEKIGILIRGGDTHAP